VLLRLVLGGDATDGTATENALGALFDALARDCPSPANKILAEVGWPSDGTAPSASNLRAVLDLTPIEREDLRQAVRHDLTFVSHLDDPSFSFRFPALPEPQFSAGKRLLVSMYDHLGRRGIGINGRGVMTRASWEAELWRANPDLQVCPACLVHRLEAAGGGTSKISLDHYLPKAQYSPLAVHPMNMVPLCPPCNDRVKGSVDPLAGSVTLDDIWLPYKRPGIDNVRILIQQEQPARERVTLQGLDEVSDGRMRRFDTLFDLSHRWSELLTATHQSLTKALARAYQKGWPEVLDALQDEAAVSSTTLLREPLAFLRAAYAKWLLEDEDALFALRDELYEGGRQSAASQI
jgi:hypothetical protein